MPGGSRAGTPAAVFFDPTGRRRRFVRATLLLVTCGSLILTALEVIGLTAQAPPPRVVVGTSARHAAGARVLARPGVTAVLTGARASGEPVSRAWRQSR